MKNKNDTQIEFALQPSPDDIPFFTIRRRSPTAPKRRIPLHRSRFWFQRMHAIIDSIPEPERA
jgi:hypothetical protein